jgi:hypothetical protein
MDAGVPQHVQQSMQAVLQQAQELLAAKLAIKVSAPA